MLCALCIGSSLVFLSLRYKNSLYTIVQSVEGIPVRQNLNPCKLERHVRFCPQPYHIINGAARCSQLAEHQMPSIEL